VRSFIESDLSDNNKSSLSQFCHY